MTSYQVLLGFYGKYEPIGKFRSRGQARCLQCGRAIGATGAALNAHLRTHKAD